MGFVLWEARFSVQNDNLLDSVLGNDGKLVCDPGTEKV